MLLRALDGSRSRTRNKREKEEGRLSPPPDPYAVAALGRRPRLATAVPGILPAQSSQRSACFEPRRASAKLIRITAPRPSATSFEQLSQTSRVTRANAFPPSKGVRL